VLGWAARTGAMNSVIAGQLARATGVTGGSAVPRDHMTAAGGEQGSRLPVSFFVALTPTALRVFKFRRGWTGVKVKKELGALPRDGLVLAVDDAGITKRFQLQATDGSAIGFEMTRSKFASTFADDLQAALPSA
jgi:hypothetical protein